MKARMSSVWTSKFRLSSILLIGSLAVGCIENGSTTETPGGGTLPPVDFNAPPPTSSGGGTTSGGGGGSTQTGTQFKLGIQLEGGAKRTNKSVLRATLFENDWTQMKISWNLTCTGGTWEPWSLYKDIQVPTTNTTLSASAQFVDLDGITSECFKAQIIHDDLGPQILIKKYPAPSLEVGTAPEIEYEVTDASAITSVKCRLNSIEKPCASGGPHTITITQLPEANYQFTFEAQDELGNMSSQSVNWAVVDSTRRLTQTFNVNDYRKVDILMVIDNSGSMAYEQKNMAQRMGNFLSILRGLDYQIAVTTTDARDIALGDGRLIPIYGSGGQYILDTTTPETVAQERLGMTLQRPETGSGSEQGIYATYRVVERSLSNENPHHRQLIRTGAQFATVLISDEDESANGAKNDPHNLIKLIAESFGGQKSFGYHSIITRPGDTNCRNTYGAAYGERYKMISELTGGIIGSVCEADYAQQVQGVAQRVRDLLKTLTLQCAPLAQYPITIMKDGMPFSGTYVVEGVNLRFAQELPAGNFSVDYRCLK